MILAVEHGCNLHDDDDDDDDEDKFNGKKKWARALNNVIGKIKEDNVHVQLTRAEIVKRQFEALQTRRNFLSIARDYRVRHRQEMRAFLTSPKCFPPSLNIVKHFSSLYDKHHLTITMMRSLSPEGLATATKIPLGDAIHITRSLKKYPKTSSELESDKE